MIFRIKITEQADSDLRGIFEYIAFDLKSMQPPVCMSTSDSGRIDTSHLHATCMPDQAGNKKTCA